MRLFGIWLCMTIGCVLGEWSTQRHWESVAEAAFWMGVFAVAVACDKTFKIVVRREDDQ